MRYILLFLSTALCLSSNAQQVYGSISIGEQLITEGDQVAFMKTNAYLQISTPWLWSYDFISFKRLTNFDLSFGYLMNNNLGIELTSTYLKPSNSEVFANYVTKTLSGNFFRINPKIVVNLNLNKFQIYSKVGFIIGAGQIRYNQYFQNDGTMNVSAENESLIYLYNGGKSYGFNASIGFSKMVSKKIYVFTEINAVSQNFSPTKGKTIEHKIDGQDVLTNNMKPYTTEIEFCNDQEFVPYSSDNANPQKLYKHAYSLGGYGLTIGIKFIIWKKEEVRDSEI